MKISLLAPLPASAMDARTHRNGFALYFGGEEVAVFPSFIGLRTGRRAAREALLLLDTTLAKPRREDA